MLQQGTSSASKLVMTRDPLLHCPPRIFPIIDRDELIWNLTASARKHRSPLTCLGPQEQSCTGIGARSAPVARSLRYGSSSSTKPAFDRSRRSQYNLSIDAAS